MTNNLNDVLNEAIPLWAKLTGTQLGTNSYTFTLGSTSEFQSYTLKKYIDDLNEARAFDMSGTTAILLLRGLFEAYTQEQVFKAHTLLYDPARVEAALKGLREFHQLISLPVCEEACSSFKEDLRTGALHYGYAAAKLLTEERPLGELRLASYRSLEQLAVHQFTQGARDPKPLQYNREIFEFSNVNSFIHALQKQLISGITLAMIRGEDDCQAYFVLGLRNGDTITTLTDFKEGEHPEYHNMTRRPDRRLEERARQHWFPYRLLRTDPVKRKQTKAALVNLDTKAIPTSSITDLEPSEFVWLSLLFNLIADKFGHEDFKTPELSYTGEMVVSPHVLVEATSALVQAGHYKALVLPKMTHETVTPEAAANKKPLGHNAWMEERYNYRVPEILLDVVGDRKALEVGKAAQKLLGKINYNNLPSERKQPGVIGWGPDYRVKPLQPLALDPTYLGTRENIEKNRAWYARQNLIQGVQQLATAEFVVKQKMVLSYYRKRIEQNMPFIWKAVTCGELMAPITAWKSHEEHGFPAEDELHWEEGNILHQKFDDDRTFWSQGTLKFGDWDPVLRYRVCATNPPMRANVFTTISPDNPRALALLMGIPEKKLPWPFQHWTTREPYTGNSILDRIDPQDSRLDNPWRHLDLSIGISLSKRGYNRLRKEHGLQPRKVERVA